MVYHEFKLQQYRVLFKNTQSQNESMYKPTQKIVELANIYKSDNIHLCDLISRDKIIVKYPFSCVEGMICKFYFCSIVCQTSTEQRGYSRKCIL